MINIDVVSGRYDVLDSAYSCKLVAFKVFFFLKFSSIGRISRSGCLRLVRSNTLDSKTSHWAFLLGIQGDLSPEWQVCAKQTASCSTEPFCPANFIHCWENTRSAAHFFAF